MVLALLVGAGKLRVSLLSYGLATAVIVKSVAQLIRSGYTG
jgi:hypothetical protein